MNFTAKGGRVDPSPTKRGRSKVSLRLGHARGKITHRVVFLDPRAASLPSPTDCIYIPIVSVTIAEGNHFTKRLRFISRPKVISSPKDISLRSSASLYLKSSGVAATAAEVLGGGLVFEAFFYSFGSRGGEYRFKIVRKDIA